MGFTTMYVGATGMKAYASGMQVTGNNIANVNTVGFKAGRTQFESLISQDVSYGSPEVAQFGRGVQVADVIGDFREGAFQAGTASTDLAIGGKGFFRVHDSDTGEYYFTRAGNFRFNKDGYLVDPHTRRLMGYPVDQETGQVIQTSEEIRLPMKTEIIHGEEVEVVKSDPRATSSVNMITNLDSNSQNRTVNEDNPFFAMASAWNGLDESPISSDGYSYNSALKIYDADGTTHNLQVYFDPVGVEGAGGIRYWEYIVTVDPAEDGRAGMQGTSGAGLLMMGTFKFTGNGEMADLTAYTLSSGATGSVKDLSNWTLASFSESGHPQLSASFVASDSSTAVQNIHLDFGMRDNSGQWSAPSGNTAASVGSNASNLPGLADKVRSAQSTTDYYGSSVTISQSQDGYGEGYLQNVSVDANGFLQAEFTNGQVEKLYQINMYGFTNEYGLRREGSNNFSATDSSGAALEGVPNDYGMGSAKSYGFGSTAQDTLEASNVDMADQFAQMILDQRGFQANSKVVTTTDSMIGTLINVKR